MVCSLLYGEATFEDLLKRKGLEYKFHKKIFIHDLVAGTPDFYLPKYDLYVEVVSNRQTLTVGRYKKLAKLIKHGYKLSFYHHGGQKIKFTELALSRLGVNSNDDIMSIPELEG